MSADTNQFNLGDIRFSSEPASSIFYDEWAEIVYVNQQAVNAVYGESFAARPDVRRSIGDDNFDTYIESRLEPNNLVGSSYNADNLYRDPLITLARSKRSSEIVAVTYTADNVSGATEQMRQAKMDARLPLKRWAWLGWTATLPDYQHRGIATAGVAFALRKYNVLQPTSAYAWINEADGSSPADGLLRRNGLHAQGEPFSKTPDSPGLQRYAGRVFKNYLNFQLQQAIDSTLPRIP